MRRSSDSQLADAVNALILIAAAVFVVMFLYHLLFAGFSSKQYYGVFLDSGDVYFALIDSDKGDYMELTDIYYLQNSSNPETAGGEFSLARLGGEVHGPENLMYLNKDHILNVQPLSSDSEVLRAIVEYKQQ